MRLLASWPECQQHYTFIFLLGSPAGTQPRFLILLTPTGAPHPAAALAAGRGVSQLALVPPDARVSWGHPCGLHGPQSTYHGAPGAWHLLVSGQEMEAQRRDTGPTGGHVTSEYGRSCHQVLVT